jgi:hypothetical protein
VTMSDTAMFFWFFAGLFVLRIIAATFVYAWLLSEAPECPACGGETLHMQRHGISWLFPRLRPSWCPECDWEGMLQPARNRDVPIAQPSRESTNTPSHSGQLPLISKKSSK